MSLGLLRSCLPGMGHSRGISTSAQPITTCPHRARSVTAGRAGMLDGQEGMERLYNITNRRHIGVCR